MSQGFTVFSVQTEVFKQGQNLAEFITQNLKNTPLQDGDILAVTSKIVSLAENRVLSPEGVDKTSLVQQESDVYIGEIGYGCHLTVKHGLLIPSAGIDESNSQDGSYILFPEHPFESAKNLWLALRKHFGLNNLGVLITDSHTSPLRKGVTGIALSHWGFEGVKNRIGQPDLFGRQLKMTQINVADALSVAAVYCMGEANEQTPLAIIRGASVKYVVENSDTECCMPLKEDLYYPLLASALPKNSI